MFDSDHLTESVVAARPEVVVHQLTRLPAAIHPRRVPALVARVAAGSFTTMLATQLRGASNARFRREFGWRPRYGSWRTGFVEALG